MAPQQHIEWLEDNIGWFEAVPVEQLRTEVPSCPGWNVEYVMNHLSFGLGLAYPAAMSKGPDIDPNRAFDGIALPDAYPEGPAVVDAFSENMRACLRRFRSTDPDTPCWTYAGPGKAGFWFRRAAIETTLHRMDVEEALRAGIGPIHDDRLHDAIAETVEFALPLAATVCGRPSGRLEVSAPGSATPLSVGDGVGMAGIDGDAMNVLGALWGRHRDRVTVTGDPAVADEWLRLIERAFSDR